MARSNCGYNNTHRLMTYVNIHDNMKSRRRLNFDRLGTRSMNSDLLTIDLALVES